jgi:hypothetical protein
MVINPSRFNFPKALVTVEFDGPRGTRLTKTLADAVKARAFWLRQEAAGNHPKIVKEAK